MAEPPRDSDAHLRRTAELERTVIGGAPIAGGPTLVSTGAFDTSSGGGETGGAGRRDPGDSTDRLSPENSAELTRGAPTRAEEVFGSDEDTNTDQISDALRHESDQSG